MKPHSSHERVVNENRVSLSVDLTSGRDKGGGHSPGQAGNQREEKGKDD